MLKGEPMRYWFDSQGKWHRGKAPSDAKERLRGEVRGEIRKELGTGKWQYAGLLMEWQPAKSRREAKRRVKEIDRGLTDPKCASPY